MADFSFDFSEVAQLAADLGEVQKGTGEFVSKAVQVSARRVKDAWRARLSGSGTLPGAASSIAYELTGGNAIRGSTITAEIKPRLGGQGSLVWVPEFGSLSTSPRGYGRASLEENADDFQKGIDMAIADGLKVGGL